MKKIIFISMIFLGISALLISCSDDNIPPVDIPGIYDETIPSGLVGDCQNNYSLALGTETESLMGAAIKMDTILAGKGSQIIAVRRALYRGCRTLRGVVHFKTFEIKTPVFPRICCTGYRLGIYKIGLSL